MVPNNGIRLGYIHLPQYHYDRALTAGDDHQTFPYHQRR